MTRTSILLSAALLLTAGTAATAVAKEGVDHIMIRHHGGPGGPESHAHFFAHLSKKLDLTTEQQAALKEQMAKVHATIEPLFAEHETQHEALRTALDSGADATTVGELAIAAHRTMEKIHTTHKEAAAAFLPLLTAEQAEKFREIMENRKMFHHRIVVPHE